MNSTIFLSKFCYLPSYLFSHLLILTVHHWECLSSVPFIVRLLGATRQCDESGATCFARSPCVRLNKAAGVGRVWMIWPYACSKVQKKVLHQLDG